MSKILNTLSDISLQDMIKAGKIGVIPTDTVYGLVCLASDEQAVAKLYGTKHRDKKPGTVIASNIQQLVDLGIKARYLKAVEQYWPNPISIIIPSMDLKFIHLGVGSIAVRITADIKLKELIEVTGPLLTTSANMPGEPEASTIDEARKYFNDAVDFYVDGGDLSGRNASTVIRIVDDAVEVLRQGALKIDESGRIIE